MNPETGEIKKVQSIPEGWVGLPNPGDIVEVVAPPSNKRGRKWKVVAISDGTPGQLVLEPLPETVVKVRRGYRG